MHVDHKMSKIEKVVIGTMVLTSLAHFLVFAAFGWDYFEELFKKNTGHYRDISLSASLTFLVLGTMMRLKHAYLEHRKLESTAVKVEDWVTPAEKLPLVSFRKANKEKPKKSCTFSWHSPVIQIPLLILPPLIKLGTAGTGFLCTYSLYDLSKADIPAISIKLMFSIGFETLAKAVEAITHLVHAYHATSQPMRQAHIKKTSIDLFHMTIGILSSFGIWKAVLEGKSEFKPMLPAAGGLLTTSFFVFLWVEYSFQQAERKAHASNVVVNPAPIGYGAMGADDALPEERIRLESNSIDNGATKKIDNTNVREHSQSVNDASAADDDDDVIQNNPMIKSTLFIPVNAAPADQTPAAEGRVGFPQQMPRAFSAMS